MILQALCDEYTRNADSMPSFGFEEKPIPFTVVITKDGRLVHLEDNREVVKKQLKPKIFRVPKAPGRSGGNSYKTSNLLWDHYGYVLAEPSTKKPGMLPTDKEVQAAQNQHESFCNLVAQIKSDLPHDSGVSAVSMFLDSNIEKQKLREDDLWLDCKKVKSCNITFRIQGESNLVCQSPTVIDWVKNLPQSETDTKDGLCLVTGKKTGVVRLHNTIAGIAQKPAPLLSINLDAFESYEKKQGFNFPISAFSAFEYATALNYMLRGDSLSKFRIADTTYVCWAKNKSDLETTLPFVFTGQKDDPERGADALRCLIASVHSGAYTSSQSEDEFYVLGLAPNSARIMIRFWQIGTITDMSKKIAMWFEDISLDENLHELPTLKDLLRCSALQYKDDNIAPNRPAAVMKSILCGTKLPSSFYQDVIQRIKADKITLNRIRIIKAYLNRQFRDSPTHSNRKEITMALNREDHRPGYCLGRLFATLEKLQKDANPEIKATIYERYYRSASCTPQAVFTSLMRLSSCHIEKLKKNEYKIHSRKVIGEIVDLIQEFPATLNMEQQGLFAVGYFHQQQDTFKKKASTHDKGK